MGRVYGVQPCMVSVCYATVGPRWAFLPRRGSCIDEFAIVDHVVSSAGRFIIVGFTDASFGFDHGGD